MSIEGCGREKALILAVLLWMACGGEAESERIYLEADRDNALVMSSTPPTSAEVSHFGTSLMIAGGEWGSSTDWYFRGGCASRKGVSVREYNLVIEGAKGVYVAYGGEAHGDDTNRGDASGNKVTIRDDSSITGVVCGGFVGGRGDAAENTVDVSDSLVTGVIYGGRVGRYGNVTGNSVILNNSQAQTVYGGYSGDGDAAENRVIIRNSKAMDVYGSRGGVGRNETGNRVLLDHADIFGRVSGASENGRGWDGCTLILSGDGNTVGRIQRFEEIELSETLSWRNHGTVLKAGAFEDWDGKLDASKASFSTVTTPGVMTLLSSDRENDFADLILKYKGGTARLNAVNPSRNIWVGCEGTRSKNGVKLSYNPVHRILLDEESRYKNVFYQIENRVNTVSLGNVGWRTGGTVYAVGSGYDFSETVLDVSEFRFQNPEAVPGSGVMALLSGAENLSSGMERTGISSFYAYAPISGVTVSGHILGDISVEGERLLYKARENRADRLSFGKVAWTEESALMVRPSNIVFDGAAVDTSRIYFHNVASLRANQSMVLVEDFGNSVGAITGDTYTVGTTLTGRGRAFLSGRNLIYRVETGTESPGIPSLGEPSEPILSSGETPGSTPVSDNSSLVHESSAANAQASENHGKSFAGGAVAANDGQSSTENSMDQGAGATEAVSSSQVPASEPVPILTAQDQTHNTVMGMEAGMAALAAGNDYIARATDGLGTQAGPDGIAAFVALGGGREEYETGSCVKGNTWNAILALGAKHAYSRGTLEWGGFLEHGTGNFSVYGDNGRGELSSTYTGGGMLAKWTYCNGVYAEGSIRGGRMHDRASNILRDALGDFYGYDVRANYRGGHVGVGKVYRFRGNRSLDIFGKFFVMRRDGVSFQAGGRYDLDDVTSKLLCLGVRYSMEGQKWNWHGGLSWDWEFDGEASGTADGARIRSASIRGGSLGAELGIRMEPTESSPWKMDIGISGHLGKHRGVGGSVAIAYMF